MDFHILIFVRLRPAEKNDFFFSSVFYWIRQYVIMYSQEFNQLYDLQLCISNFPYIQRT